MTYIHPDGTHVGTTDTPGEIATWHESADGPGDRQYIHPARAAAIHAAYLDSLGWWLDEPTGYLVSTTPQAGGGYWVVSRDANGPAVWIRFPDDDALDAPQQILSRYLATLPPQPEPQMGEVWEVTRAGKKVREVVSASGTHFLGVVDAVHDTCHVGNIAPSERRLLITTDGEWVGGES